MARSTRDAQNFGDIERQVGEEGNFSRAHVAAMLLSNGGEAHELVTS